MSEVDRLDPAASRRQRYSELELESRVARCESEALVESVRFRPGDVRRELHKGAPASSRLVDRPLHDAGAEPGTPVIGADPYGLDLPAKRATSGQTGDDRQLQGTDWLVLGDGNDQELIRVRVNIVEGAQVRIEVAGVVPGRAELVVCQHVHDRTDVVTSCPANGVVGH